MGFEVFGRDYTCCREFLPHFGLQERAIFAHTYICWLATSSTSPSLCQRLRMRISHPFSERILNTLVGITHYFSSYVPSFRAWTKPAALYLHGSVQTWICAPVLHCQCLAANGFLYTKTTSFPSPPSSTTSRLSLCNACVAQGITKTRHRTVQVKRGLGTSAANTGSHLQTAPVTPPHTTACSHALHSTGTPN